MSQNLNITPFTKGYIQTLLFVESQHMKHNEYIANHPKEWGEENQQLSQQFIDVAERIGREVFGQSYSEQQFWSSDNTTLEADVAFVKSLLDDWTWNHIVVKCEEGFIKRYHPELKDNVDAGRYFYFTHNRHGVSFMEWENGGYDEEKLKEFFNSAVKFQEEVNFLGEYYDADY